MAADAPVPAIRVAVVNYNSGPWLARCLASLQAQTFRDFEVVVLDNASTDGSFPVALDDPRFTFVEAGENLGFAAGNNRALCGARTRWLALLNPDAMAEPDWLEHLMDEAKRHPRVRIFGSTQLRADDPATLDGTGDCLGAWGLAWRSGFGRPRADAVPDGEMIAVCGAALFIDRALFERLGGFEEKFFCYLEDVDLCLRARLAGERVRQCASAVVHHAGGASTDGGRSAFSLTLGRRNLVWMLARNLPLPLLPGALAGNAVLTTLRAAMTPDAQQRTALLRGLAEGYADLLPVLAERRRIQSARRVGTVEVARWLEWNPLSMPSRRARVLKD
ncbi:MAG TPA: glycosyltransferase family 2 protein [Candidatus Limnocylindria bacterium]|nr:glycosyltransferase family 2 protein [Candidatus Limnocylindria bacterium]